MTGLGNIAQSTLAIDRRVVAHDLWPRRLIERREGDVVQLPARVFWPEDAEEVASIVRTARRDRRPIVPFGAGSGVCGGISPTDEAWIIDTKRMARVLEIDEERETVTCEAGLIGERLERALNARGYSLGHFPSSIYCSTVGGWVAARSAGQLSSRYGKIEDIIVSLEGVDGRGEHISASLEDEATGPGALRLLVGSEGALCVIVRCTFRMHRLATHRFMRGFSFDGLEPAITTMQQLLKSGEAPSVLRIYDPLDTLIAGAPKENDEPHRIVAGGIACAGLEHSGPEDDGDADQSPLDAFAERVERLALFTRPRATRRVVGELLARPTVANTILDRWVGRGAACRMVLGIEGDGDDLPQRARDLTNRVRGLGGTDAGDGPGTRWLLHRHRVSYRMSRAFAAGGWVDTMEVATGWDGVIDLYHGVKEALRDVAIVMCHFSHAYVDGCSLYFTFAGGGAAGSRRHTARSRYDTAWERALLTVRRQGAVIAHHHGVGRSKAAALKRDDGSNAVLNALKAGLDPDNILNPGVIGLGGPP